MAGTSSKNKKDETITGFDLPDFDGLDFPSTPVQPLAVEQEEKTFTFTDQFGNALPDVSADGLLKTVDWSTYGNGLEAFDIQTEDDLRSVLSDMYDENGERMYTDEDIDSMVDNIYNTQLQVYANEYLSNSENDIKNNSLEMSWDPRLARLDTFIMKSGEGTDAAHVQIPFATAQVSSAFYNMVFNLEAGVIKQAKSNGAVPSAYDYIVNQIESDYGKSPSNSSDSKTEQTTNQSYSKAVTRTQINTNLKARYAVNGVGNGKGSNGSKVVDLNTMGDYLAPPALMNPYAVTRLIGSFSDPQGRDQLPSDNYMYDIRDQRRYYAFNDTGSYTQIASPTVSHIIEYSNQDPWGRTPYSFQDFVYCKWFGKIPNNRLITLRRYHAPTRDNLNFETMYGDPDSGGNMPMGRDPKKGEYFAPRCTVVGYIGENTGNTLAGLMNFTTGIPWKDQEAKIHDVNGNEESDHQAVIDSMFEQGGNFSAENGFFSKLFSLGGTVGGKIMSFGKMTAAMNSKIKLSNEAQQNMLKINDDPYQEGGPYENRIKGPLNRIDKVKKREAGISFEQQLQVVVEYTSKAIGGINPKAAMLDILANCMEMVSPNAVFWGGGHRYMVTPEFYAFHDGGWRDSFMEKLYKGKVFGNDGAIASSLNGLAEFGKKATENGQTTAQSAENLMSHLGDVLGDGLAMLSGMISSVTTSLFGEGTNMLTSIMQSASDFLSGKTSSAADAVSSEQGQSDNNAMQEKGKQMMSNMMTNMNTMWHSRTLAATTMPQLHGIGALLIGEPVGEWHLTVGNPLNPIMVIGNLICEKMQVDWGEELGPDDFPTSLKVTYTLQHGMARDRSAIQSMFNRGAGLIYELPDYVKSTADEETKVDQFTGGTNYRQPEFMSMADMRNEQMTPGATGRNQAYQKYVVPDGTTPSNTGNSSMVTTPKFSGLALNWTNKSLSDLTSKHFITSDRMPLIRALGITRKMQS